MTPRFRADWDEFPTLATYEAFSDQWITEAVRCLDRRGSLFICCSHFSVGPVSRMLQAMGLNVVQHIQVICLNGRPLIKPRLLQHSHFTVVWATKDGSDYHFNGHQAKRAHWTNDPFSEEGRMMRDIWFIPNAGHENKTRFPAQKPIELYERILTMCGRPGGTMLDLFAGSGTGAVAALRWGMKSISIERDPGYVDDIVERLRAEHKAK